MRQTRPCPPCPNPACPQPHVVRNGHLSGQQRSHCQGCGAWFGQTHGTPLYRLRTPAMALGLSDHVWTWREFLTTPSRVSS